jgi:DNA recombination protein RmuC
MQALATGVGDLKRVLTGIKTRGVWSEVSLGGLLEDILSPEQFANNVEVVPHSGRRVEFAVRFPGQDPEMPVWLPIDAKFPIEDYDRLIKALESADQALVESAGNAIEARIKASAREISEKYISAPYSTDFGILYLPIEGLFAEVIRRSGLTEFIQQNYRVTVAGPTTLGAYLSSVRMGFRTLAIHRQTNEVWRVLGAAKTEFEKFSSVLDRVKKKLDQAATEIDSVAVRQRAVKRALQSVESLPDEKTQELLELPGALALEADEHADDAPE